MTSLATDLKVIFKTITELHIKNGTIDFIYDHECVGLVTLLEIKDILRHLCLECTVNGSTQTAVAYPISYCISCPKHKYIQSLKLRILFCNLDEVDWLIDALESLDNKSLSKAYVDTSLTNSFPDDIVCELFNFYVREVKGLDVYLKKINDSWSLTRERSASFTTTIFLEKFNESICECEFKC